MSRWFSWLTGRVGALDDRRVDPRQARGRARAVPAYPATYAALDVAPEPGVSRPKVFDPAFRHFAHGFRVGEPTFDDEDTARRWRAARRQVMDHVLRTVGESPWAEHLVLRGSVLLKAWFGEAAREPGDLDWVAVPPSLGADDPRAGEMFNSLIRTVCDRAAGRIGSAEIVESAIATDPIWTYERAPGRRVVFPWRADGLPPGAVQMDVVFGEQLLLPPERVFVPAADGDGGATVLAAGMGLSLAWKILWLETDSSPQGKDLYDAVLLAESASLPADILRRALAPASWLKPEQINAGLPLPWSVDWETFKAEYPWVEGDADTWERRLSQALRKTLPPGGA